MKKITTAEAEVLLDQDVPYVDVRTAEEFTAGHVPGSVNIPFLVREPSGQLVANLSFVQIIEDSFEKDQQLIVGCRSGARSAKACIALAAAGYTELRDMSAGFLGGKDPFGRPIHGWQQEGREVEVATDTESDRTYTGMQRVVTKQSLD